MGLLWSRPPQILNMNPEPFPDDQIRVREDQKAQTPFWTLDGLGWVVFYLIVVNFIVSGTYALVGKGGWEGTYFIVSLIVFFFAFVWMLITRPTKEFRPRQRR